MVPELRRTFNERFTEERYHSFLAALDEAAGAHIEFRVSETPLFLSRELTGHLVQAAWEVFAAVTSPTYLAAAERAVPPGLQPTGEEEHPTFLQIDFALTREAGGEIVPQLIELQGFPSLYGFQWLLAREYRAHYPEGLALPPGWRTYFVDGEAAYVERLREAILAGHDPENVVLLEIEPEHQKTRVDFACMERLLGIRSVDVRDLKPRGRRLFCPGPGGGEVAVERIYNRVILDEAERKGLDLLPLFSSDFDVEWTGHPAWFARISKFALPFVESRYAPPAWFVSDLERLPDDLENYVLKPLFSFAGLGVEMGPSAERLRALEKPQDFILQRKVDYAPVIETPDEPAKAEVRMMFLWKDRPLLVNNLVRTSKGKMMGVDFNKDRTWIGASVAFHPPVEGQR
jgi:hypothetical protein